MDLEKVNQTDQESPRKVAPDEYISPVFVLITKKWVMRARLTLMQKLQGGEERPIKVLEEKGSSLHTEDCNVFSTNRASWCRCHGTEDEGFRDPVNKRARQGCGKSVQFPGKETPL
jgi:hypothetical protein